MSEIDVLPHSALASYILTIQDYLQMGFVMGLGVALLIGLGLEFGSGVFSKDISVKHIISIGLPVLIYTRLFSSNSFIFYLFNFSSSPFHFISIISLLLGHNRSIQ